MVYGVWFRYIDEYVDNDSDQSGSAGDEESFALIGHFLDGFVYF